MSTPVTALRSPEVNPDRTVTLRFRAPQAAPLVRIPGETTMFSDRFAKDLIEEVIPLVERTYRSAAIGGQIGNTEAGLQKVLSNPGAVNDKLRLLWVSCGRDDLLFQNNRQFVETLTSKGIKVTYRETDGAHVWSVWRRNLFEIAPLLFRK